MQADKSKFSLSKEARKLASMQASKNACHVAQQAHRVHALRGIRQQPALDDGLEGAGAGGGEAGGKTEQVEQRLGVGGDDDAHHLPGHEKEQGWG